MATKYRELSREIQGIAYTLTQKNVKNINLRVRPDGSVAVSAHPTVPLSYIDSFVVANQGRIERAQAQFASAPVVQDTISQSERRKMAAAFLPIATQVTEEIHPKFQKYHVPMPEVKVRYMKSRWGSCYTTRGIIVLNTQLLWRSLESIEYVVVHELCHFVHPDHSSRFYALMEEMMPDWRVRRQALRTTKPV